MKKEKKKKRISFVDFLQLYSRLLFRFCFFLYSYLLFSRSGLRLFIPFSFFFSFLSFFKKNPSLSFALGHPRLSGLVWEGIRNLQSAYFVLFVFGTFFDCLVFSFLYKEVFVPHLFPFLLSLLEYTAVSMKMKYLVQLIVMNQPRSSSRLFSLPSWNVVRDIHDCR